MRTSTFGSPPASRRWRPSCWSGARPATCVSCRKFSTSSPTWHWLLKSHRQPTVLRPERAAAITSLPALFGRSTTPSSTSGMNRSQWPMARNPRRMSRNYILVTTTSCPPTPLTTTIGTSSSSIRSASWLGSCSRMEHICLICPTRIATPHSWRWIGRSRCSQRPQRPTVRCIPFGAHSPLHTGSGSRTPCCSSMGSASRHSHLLRRWGAAPWQANRWPCAWRAYPSSYRSTL
mmetsp:Transcript_71018/g.230571  ORF Transcript_71018/g.230571 Transcript_71018/m.230571 type:complete len:233 (+) Transcript_71018:1133-1831(+)